MLPAHLRHRLVDFLLLNPFLYSLYVNTRVVSTLLFTSQSRQWGAVEAAPGLYLGNLADSLQLSALKAHNVTHVLSVVQGVPSTPYTWYLVRAPGCVGVRLQGCGFGGGAGVCVVPRVNTARACGWASALVQPVW
jgi:hypothetical protein